MYSLYNIEQTSNTSTSNLSIKNDSDLLAMIKNQRSRKIPFDQFSGTEMKCQICDSSCDVERLVRSCLCSDYPCEGHSCSCRAHPYPLCSKCLARQLWLQTADIMKKRNSFRSQCPFCKAEFCHNDILLFTITSTSLSSNDTDSALCNENVQYNHNTQRSQKTRSCKEHPKRKPRLRTVSFREDIALVGTVWSTKFIVTTG